MKDENNKHRLSNGVFLNLSTFVAHQLIKDSILASKEISPRLIQVLPICADKIHDDCVSPDNMDLS